MDNNDLVSVIITTYKRPVEILQRAVKSVLSQTYSHLELIVVNDYPSNKALVSEIAEMLEKLYDGRVKYIVQEKNSGACKARNTGILHSSGSFIGFLDDDDEWIENKLEEQLRCFSQQEVGIVYSAFYNVLPGSNAEQYTSRGTKSGYLLDDLLWKNCVGGTSNPLIKRKVFEDCGLFDEELLSSQDYDMWIRIAQKYQFAYCPKPLTKRYMGSESISFNFEKQKQGFYRLNEKYNELYCSNKSAFNYRLNQRVNKWLGQGYVQEAWKLYLLAVKTDRKSVV